MPPNLSSCLPKTLKNPVPCRLVVGWVCTLGRVRRMRCLHPQVRRDFVLNGGGARAHIFLVLLSRRHSVGRQRQQGQGQVLSSALPPLPPPPAPPLTLCLPCPQPQAVMPRDTCPVPQRPPTPRPLLLSPHHSLGATLPWTSLSLLPPGVQS